MISPPPDDQTVWSRSGSALLWESYPDAAAVFDPDTGETQFLSELPAMLLDQIDETPVTLSALIERLDGPDDLVQESRQQIRAALLSLERVELITSETVDTD